MEAAPPALISLRSRLIKRCEFPLQEIAKTGETGESRPRLFPDSSHPSRLLRISALANKHRSRQNSSLLLLLLQSGAHLRSGELAGTAPRWSKYFKMPQSEVERPARDEAPMQECSFFLLSESHLCFQEEAEAHVRVLQEPRPTTGF